MLSTRVIACLDVHNGRTVKGINFINLKDIPAKDLRKILIDAKKRKQRRIKLNTLENDKDAPLKGKMLIQMFEKASLRTRLSFYLAIKQLGGSTLTLRPDELHLSKGGESIIPTKSGKSGPKNCSSGQNSLDRTRPLVDSMVLCKV